MTAQLDQAVTLASLDEAVVEAADEEMTLHELLADHDEYPLQKAARQIDWAELLVEMDDREIALLQCAVNGDRLN